MPWFLQPLREYVARFNAERPHQALGNRPLPRPGPDPPALPFPDDGVVCRTRPGGLLRHYRRAA